MKRLLLALACTVCLPFAASATTIDAFGVTSSIATSVVGGPVLLNNTNAFSVQDISDVTINQPLTIYFVTQPGAAVPVVTSASYTMAINHTQSITTPIGGPFPVSFFGTLPGGTASPGPDLYSFVGCTACNHSISPFPNILAALINDGLATPTSDSPTLEVYSVVIPQSFVGQDQVNIVGNFANGTVVAPLAINGATIDDTSWVNAGFTNCTGPNAMCGTTPQPPPPPIPEPATLVLFGIGLLGIGVAKIRR